MKFHLQLPEIFIVIVAFTFTSCKKTEEIITRTVNDTIQSTLPASAPSPQPPPVISDCQGRARINASLVQIGSLSSARFGLFAGAAGSKIVFAGGWEPGAHSSRVDIYDTITRRWSTYELSEKERDGMVVASVGNKVLFAGGGNNDWVDMTAAVDIYDASTDTWCTAKLKQSRNYLAATTLGNKVFFAGGGIWGPITGGPPPSTGPTGANYHIGSTSVDIYDNTTNSWSTANLSEGRFGLSATVAGNKIYFAGGYPNIFNGSKRIDIYDASSGSWSISELHESKSLHAGITVGNKIFWAAGAKSPYGTGLQLSDQVEIRDILTGASSFACITPKDNFSAVLKNDNLIFFTGYNSGPGNKFDIFTTTTNIWSEGLLPVSIHGSAIISVNNTIYVAGGMVDGMYSDKVWRLEF